MNDETKNKSKKFISKPIFKVIIIIACVLICIAGLYALIHKKRIGITEMENIFGITVTDDMTLKNYNLDTLRLGGLLMLEVVVDDYQSFLENKIPGTIEDYEEYDNSGKIYARFKYTKDNHTVFGVVDQLNDTDYNISFSVWTSDL